MLRFVHTCILGLIAAGVVHLAIVFMLPDHTVRDAWSRISNAADYYQTIQLDARPDSPLRINNPYFAGAACRFSLEDGLLHVRSEGKIPFWTLAIFDNRSQNTFSLNDRVAEDHSLDTILLTPIQMQRLKNDPSADLGQSLFVETDVVEGFVLVRAFIPDETWEPQVRAFLNSIRCEAVETQ